jgi:hypothetical protein
MKETVHSDVQFHSQMPFTNVDVCFRNRSELEALIQALQKLLDPSTPTDSEVTLAHPHSYLPDAEGPEPEGMPTGVTFHVPGYERDDLDLRCIEAARAHLEELIEEDDDTGEGLITI